MLLFDGHVPDAGIGSTRAFVAHGLKLGMVVGVASLLASQ